MGVLRFLIDPPETTGGWPEVHRAYISGFDGRVYATRVEFDGRVLTCRRTTSESGRLHVAWPVSGFGRPVGCTATLPEREEPYVLALELARGRISFVREQVGLWEAQGMELPAEFRPLHQEAYRLFARATARQDDPAEVSRLANQSLEKEYQAAELLMRSYTSQRLAFRRRRSLQLPAALGCILGESVPSGDEGKRFCGAFTAAGVPVEWRNIEPSEGEYRWEIYDAQVEWCLQNRLLIYGGPLLDFSSGGLPRWLAQWEHDFLNLQSFACDFVETAVRRYFGRVRHWEVSACGNTGGALALGEEQRLSLAARTLDIARQIDEELELFIRVDQPWGAYQARGQHRLSPLQFVDAIVRSGIGLSGVNLEIAFGYRPRGSAPRDLLEFSRLIDQWSCLAVPLYVTLAYPSATGEDPAAHGDVEVEEPGRWKHDWSEAGQADWIDDFLPLLMAKQAVVGIYWSHWSDASAHGFPHAGLLRGDGIPREALERIAGHRREGWRGTGTTKGE